MLAVLAFWLARRGGGSREEEAALRREWGAAIDRHRDFEAYRECALRTPSPADSDELDDQTWLDLEMDEVFARVDRTLSTPGRIALYGILRRPTLARGALEARDRLVDALQRDERLRDAVRTELARLGRAARGESGLADLLWGGEVPPDGTTVWGTVLGWTGFAALTAALALGGGWIVGAVAAFAVNAHYQQRTRVRHLHEIDALVELGALLRCARSLAMVSDTTLRESLGGLTTALPATRGLARSLAFVSAGRLQDLIYEYVSVLFLLEARAVHRALRQCRERASALRALFLIVGEVDAAQAVASYRTSLPRWTRPDLVEGGRPRLAVVDAVHPLLRAARPNSVALDGRGCIVTGANMAGKSTLLRTLGVNAVMAQSIFTCTASGHTGSFLLVRSSMCVADSLVEGKSLYLAEAERALALLRAADGDRPVLCLVDELLAGTNAKDRHAASGAILAYLATRNALVVASTHDADLAEMLQEHLDPRHLDADGRETAFRLQPGITRERNALDLLVRLGFPNGVLDRLDREPRGDRRGRDDVHARRGSRDGRR